MSTLVPQPQSAISPPPKRHLRNYLLDARFQLKFTGYMLVIALCVAGLLFIFLWSSTQTLMHETELAVEARSRAAETSKELSSATLNNKVAEHLNDPDPAFDRELAEQSQKIDAQYQAEKGLILAQRADLLRRQRTVWLVLVGCLVGFVVFITAATIVATHKIVGPLFRIKRIVQDVGEGKLAMPSRPLRDGDEMQDLFHALTGMLQGLRSRQELDLEKLSAALARAENSHIDGDTLELLRALQQQMSARL